MRKEILKEESFFFIEGGDPFWSSTHWRIFGGEEQRKRRRAIATKAIQVCFLLLLEFLFILDFSVCSIPEYLIVVLIFVWTKRATICFVEIGCLLVCLVLVLDVIDVFGSI